MSSTTERGQALAIFAISLTAVLLAAALAFDVGDVLLERRNEQNAADAAAMAGARYILSSDAQATAAARAIATDNGYTHGEASREVNVNIPPIEPGPWVNFEGAIEVEICNVRPSIFAGVAGIFDWQVCARAVAAQLDGVGGPFSILALDPTGCAAVNVQGNGGEIEAHGNIQINSSCPTDALKAAGQGVINLDVDDACRVHGGYVESGQADLNCTIISPAPVERDPLEDLGEPSVSLAPTPMQVAGASKAAPSGCVSTVASPQQCQFNSSYKDTEWRLFPGLYPGGIKLQGGAFYLEPGIYTMGGGGFESTGNGVHVYAVDAGTTPTKVLGAHPTCAQWRLQDRTGGVLLFNSQLQHIDRSDAGQFGPIKLNGSDANVCFDPLRDAASDFNNLVVYQDRHYSVGGGYDVTINGNDADGLELRGSVYTPAGNVRVNGNGGNVTLDQVISYRFFASGNGGKILALDENDNVYQFFAAGLVE